MTKERLIAIIAFLICVVAIIECSRTPRVEYITQTVEIRDTVDSIELVEVEKVVTKYVTLFRDSVRVERDSVIIPIQHYDTIIQVVENCSETRTYESLYEDSNYTLKVHSVIELNELKNQWIDMSMTVTTAVKAKHQLYGGISVSQDNIRGELMYIPKGKVAIGYGYDPFDNSHQVRAAYRFIRF